MLPTKLDDLDDGKNCPKPECGKREYLTRRHAGQTLSICPNGHSWDAIEVKAQKEKQREAVADEVIRSYENDFLRDQIIPEPAQPRRGGFIPAPSPRIDERGRVTFPYGVDPLKDSARYTKIPSIRMSRETWRAMYDRGYYGVPNDTPENQPQRLLGVPVVIDETIPPGLCVWNAAVEDPFEWFLKAMTNSVAEGFGLSLNPAE